jgi:hypothetical protein
MKETIPTNKRRNVRGISTEANKLLPPRQPFTTVFNVFFVKWKDRGYSSGRELTPDNTGDCEDALFIVSETSKLFFGQLAEAFRDANFQAVHCKLQFPGAIFFTEHSPRNEIFDNAHHEKRIPFGPPMNMLTESWRKTMRGKTGIKIVRHLSFAQQVERQFFAALMGVEFLRYRLQGMLMQQDIGWTVSAQHQQAGGLGALGDGDQQVQGCGITPLQVFEN